MKIAIMQPYFFPYSGYFKLISSVDVFVLYDNIKYTKKGWVNRNRILVNGSDSSFCVPLKKDSDSLDIVDRTLATSFSRLKLINKIRGAYASAPYFKEVIPYLESIINYTDDNLFNYLHNSLLTMMALLGIKTKILVSSELFTSKEKKGKDRVISICHELGASQYINAIGGKELYSKSEFEKNGIMLSFIQSNEREYKQFELPFVPYLSIIDVIMFNSLDTVRSSIENDYCLV